MQQQGGRSQGSGQLAPQTSAKQQTGGLVETSSYKPTDAIKADLVITAQELELNVPIGVGAEGKVSCLYESTAAGAVELQNRSQKSSYCCCCTVPEPFRVLTSSGAVKQPHLADFQGLWGRNGCIVWGFLMWML
jgi:hypothetical protein